MVDSSAAAFPLYSGSLPVSVRFNTGNKADECQDTNNIEDDKFHDEEIGGEEYLY